MKIEQRAFVFLGSQNSYSVGFARSTITRDWDEPPLHTLPHDALIAKLKSLTNLRVVRDPDSAEGWKLELDPFPGWEKVPEL
ncbi:MAG: hypothetical protein BMS9Abin37_1527 [Acidobacteriota bacterium]|nr:MAG: hypothetical protein BMS9Abin37_1527 [Acidobacteriota bacterium]